MNVPGVDTIGLGSATLVVAPLLVAAAAPFERPVEQPIGGR